MEIRKRTGIVHKTCICGRTLIVEEPQPGEISTHRCVCGNRIQIFGETTVKLNSYRHLKVPRPRFRIN